MHVAMVFMHLLSTVVDTLCCSTGWCDHSCAMLDCAVTSWGVIG